MGLNNIPYFTLGSNQGSWVEDGASEQKGPQSICYVQSHSSPFSAVIQHGLSRYQRLLQYVTASLATVNDLWANTERAGGRGITQEVGGKWIPWEAYASVFKHTGETDQGGREGKGEDAQGGFEVTPRTSPEPCLSTFVKSVQRSLIPKLQNHVFKCRFYISIGPGVSMLRVIYNQNLKTHQEI